MLKALVFALVTCLCAAIGAAQTAPELIAVRVGEIEGNISAAQRLALTSKIASTLQRSGRFQLVDSSQIQDVIEKRLKCQSSQPADSQVRCDEIKPQNADFVIYGSLLSPGDATSRASEGTRARRSTRAVSQQFSVELKLADVRNGELIYQINKEFTLDLRVSQQDSYLFQEEIESTTKSLIQKIFPLAVTQANTDGTIVLNYGLEAVRRGQYLLCYSTGAPITDPQLSGRVIVSRRLIGIFRVTAVEANSATAIFVGGGPGTIAPGQRLTPIDARSAQAALRSYRGPPGRLN